MISCYIDNLNFTGSWTTFFREDASLVKYSKNLQAINGNDSNRFFFGMKLIRSELFIHNPRERTQINEKCHDVSVLPQTDDLIACIGQINGLAKVHGTWPGPYSHGKKVIHPAMSITYPQQKIRIIQNHSYLNIFPQTYNSSRQVSARAIGLGGLWRLELTYSALFTTHLLSKV